MSQHTASVVSQASGWALLLAAVVVLVLWAAGVVIWIVLTGSTHKARDRWRAVRWRRRGVRYDGRLLAEETERDLKDLARKENR
jgi:hypothetical protein